ncbi:MAG TPA: hypothetical protein VND68_10805, partial [Chloroflexia bacterium]|nr:hypothetical protein [Chloroflexia bacterium]
KLEGSTQDSKELNQKLLGLVAALGETGMEVSMQPIADGQAADGSFVLKSHSCPYFEVARNHREICDMESEMLQDLLGPGVEVRLGTRIVEGGCACDFHVSPVHFDVEKDKVTAAGRPE